MAETTTAPANPELQFLDMKKRDVNNKPTRFTTSDYEVREKKSTSKNTGKTTTRYFAVAKAPSGCEAWRVIKKPATA